MERQAQVFTTVERIFTGVGCIGEVGRTAADFGRRCVVVTGRHAMRRTGILDRVLALLRASGVEAALFEGVEEEPTAGTVDGVRALIREVKAELVIGLGGGSAMDAAKAAAGLATETSPASFFLSTQAEARPGVPLLTIATTSGTGAEVTPNAVISDPAAKVKASIRNGRFIAAAAFVDPELALSCPPRVTASSGMDAVTQAVESYVSIHAGPVSDALAVEAFRLLWGSVERAYRDGRDIDARAAAAYGSLMAGMSLSAARLGAVHGIAHPLGIRYSVPHGLACAVMLPEVVRINLPYSAEKFARLASIAGGDLVDAVRALNDRLGIYREFAAYHLAQSDFALIAEESLPSGSLKSNPKKFDASDVMAVLSAISAPR